MHNKKEKYGRSLYLAERPRLLRLPKVIDLVNLSRSQIYKMISGGKFPRQIKLSERAVAWREDEILNWIKKLNPH
ncbi:AlpA family phage regulatory protein [Oleiagrimonas soli]